MLRCLLVDDSTGFLEAARTLLEREGIAVVGMASTGAEALQGARQLDPDLVLLDISLGNESGFDVARHLKRDGRSERPSVILISTHPEDEFADLVEESPAVGFLSKSDLSARAIRDVLRGSGAGNAVSEPRGR